jgi:UDP-N-acetylglucosamine 2-epimerase (non-hydrolysing)
MERFEQVCFDEKPDMVLVVGDVNSTAACSLVAAKLHISITHYEAGLRSRDREMPEEINRLVTDAITDLFITTSSDASDNLIQEGIQDDKIHMLGNLMIDSLVTQLGASEKIELNLQDLNGGVIDNSILENGNNYAVMTFHRPANVDDKPVLKTLVDEWIKTSEQLAIIFPIHPRTQSMLEQFKLMDELVKAPNIYLTGPLTYLEFLKLLSNSALVITDSGGIQEETTFLKIPCLTVRPSTERPVTIWEGSNQLIKPHEIFTHAQDCLSASNKKTQVPKYWDGKSAGRIVGLLEDYSTKRVTR